MTNRGRTLDPPFPLDDGPTVVPSANRFAARARARRRRILVGWLLALGSVLVAGWVVLVSPWGTVQEVEVTGTRRVPVEQVRAAARAQVGRPLVLTDPAAVERTVGGLRLVAEARVHRVWPGRLRVDVRERVPVAALPAGVTGYRLVDVTGVEVERSVRAPRGLPVLQVDLVGAGPAAVRSALDSLAVVAPALRAQIREVGAGSGDAVWFRLTDGDLVVWGNAGEGELKSAALAALRRQAVREREQLRRQDRATLAERPMTFDVSAPRAPSVQR